MRTSVFRQWIGWGGVAIVIALMTGLYAEESPKSSEDKKIRISSDSMMADNQSKYVEFIGHVRAVQGDTIITSERLKIFYKDASSSEKTPADPKKQIAGSNSVDKIVASGNVKVQIEDKIAETQEAVYTTQDRVLVLTGDDSKLIFGSNSISGYKITFYRDSNKYNVEGSGKKQVEATVYSEDKGLN